jgi:hypothetical protein
MFALLGGLLLGVTPAAADDPPADQDLKTRGPAGTVPVTPEAGGAGPKTVSVTPAAAEAPKPLNFKLNYVYRPGGKGDLKPLIEGSKLNSGDHYKIKFTPAEDSYVYIFQVDSSQAIYRRTTNPSSSTSRKARKASSSWPSASPTRNWKSNTKRW